MAGRMPMVASSLPGSTAASTDILAALATFLPLLTLPHRRAQASSEGGASTWALTGTRTARGSANGLMRCGGGGHTRLSVRGTQDVTLVKWRGGRPGTTWPLTIGRAGGWERGG